MASIFRISTVIAFGLFSLNTGCSSDAFSSSEEAVLSAEQACLKTHTDEGKLDFGGGQPRQVCGAGRHDFGAGRSFSNFIELPKARSGLSFNLNFFSLRLTDSFGGYLELERARAGSSCGNGQSFQFDDDRNPTAVKLCNCDSHGSAPGAKYVDLLVGCGANTASGTATKGVTGTSGSGASTCSCNGNCTGINTNVTGSAGSGNQSMTSGGSGSKTTTTGGGGSGSSTPSTGSGSCNCSGTGNSGSADNFWGNGGSGNTSAGSGTCAASSCTACSSDLRNGTGTDSSGDRPPTTTVTTTHTITTTTTQSSSMTVTTVGDAGSSDCSCLWNVVFGQNGCAAS